MEDVRVKGGYIQKVEDGDKYSSIEFTKTGLLVVDRIADSITICNYDVRNDSVFLGGYGCTNPYCSRIIKLTSDSLVLSSLLDHNFVHRYYRCKSSVGEPIR